MALAGQEGAELRVLGRLCASLGAAAFWARRIAGPRGPTRSLGAAGPGTAPRQAALPLQRGQATKQMRRLQDDEKAPG